MSGGGNPCKNGGECVRSARWRTGGSGSALKQPQQTYSCICPLGYSGENCEVSVIYSLLRAFAKLLCSMFISLISNK